MKIVREELEPAEFIGCGLALSEWVQLTDEERTAMAMARDGLLQRLADMVVDTLCETMAEAGEDARLSDRMDDLESKRGGRGGAG